MVKNWDMCSYHVEGQIWLPITYLVLILFLAISTKRALNADNTPYLIVMPFTITAVMLLGIFRPNTFDESAALSPGASVAMEASRICWRATFV